MSSRKELGRRGRGQGSLLMLSFAICLLGFGVPAYAQTESPTTRSGGTSADKRLADEDAVLAAAEGKTEVLKDRLRELLLIYRTEKRDGIRERLMELASRTAAAILANGKTTTERSNQLLAAFNAVADADAAVAATSNAGTTHLSTRFVAQAAAIADEANAASFVPGLAEMIATAIEAGSPLSSLTPSILRLALMPPMHDGLDRLSQLVARVESARESLKPIERSLLLLVRARLRWNEGQNDIALEILREARSGLSSLPAEGRAYFARRLCSVLYGCGRPDDALVVAQDAAEACAATPAGRNDRLWFLLAIGKLHAILADAEEAIAAFDSAIAATASLASSRDRAEFNCRVQLCTLYLRIGRFDRVEIEIGRLKEALLRLGGSAQLEGAALLTLQGAVAHSAGRPDEALSAYQHARDLWLAVEGKQHNYYQLTTDIAAARRALGDYDQAEADYRDALAWGTHHNDDDVAVWTARAARMDLVELDRPKVAERRYFEVIKDLEGRRTRSKRFEELDRAVVIENLNPYSAYDGHAWALANSGSGSEAIASLERGRARSVLDLLARSDFDAVAEAYAAAKESGDKARIEILDATTSRLRNAESEISRAIATLRASRGAGSSAELERAERSLDDWVGRRRELERDRADLCAEFIGTGKPLSADGIAATLRREEVVVYYSINEWGSRVYVLDHERSVRHLDLRLLDGARASKSSVRRLVDSYKRSISRRPDGRLLAESLSDWSVKGAELFDVLIPDGLWKILVSRKRIFLVPDPTVDGLVFETLPTRSTATDGRRGSLLRSGPEIAYVPSGSLLAWLRNDRAGREGISPRLEMVAAGLGYGANPVAATPASQSSVERIGRHLNGSPPLKFARREIEAVMNAISLRRRDDGLPAQVVDLWDETATETALRRHARDARRIHIVAHMFSGTRNSSPSGLELATTADPSPTDDGILTFTDLIRDWRRSLSKCDLVVLSACRSAVSDSLAQRVGQSLAWGFFFARAGAVLASEWSVDDESTSELMAHFYSKMAEDPRIDALSAFVQARRQLADARPHPYYWAPFVFRGDPR